MSSKSSTKRSPRAMPVETIITRFKSSQRKQQTIKEQVKSVEKKKKSLKDKKHSAKAKLQTKFCNVDNRKVYKKVSDDINAEYYPEKPKREVLNRKIVLLPKHRLKVVGGMKSCNKRKLHLPQKETRNGAKRTRYHSSSSSPSDLDLNSPKHKAHSSELTIKDMVLLIEEDGGLDEEDLLEILTCPSPVWWEDPPTGYIEDPIFARPKPVEQKSVKNQLLEEQNKEAERRKLKTQESPTRTDVNKNKLDVSKIDICVGNRDEKFMTKRCKLESLLGDIKNKVKKPNGDHKKLNNTTYHSDTKLNENNNNGKDNKQSAKYSDEELNPKNKENNVVNNSNNTKDIDNIDEDLTKSGTENIHSDSFEEEQLIDLADEEILCLENIKIPIAHRNAPTEITDNNTIDGCQIATKSSCIVIEDDDISKNLKETGSLSEKLESNQVETEISSITNELISANDEEIDVSSNIDDTMPCIRVPKNETLSAESIDENISESRISADVKDIALNNQVMASETPPFEIKPTNCNNIAEKVVISLNESNKIPYICVKKIETLSPKIVEESTKDNKNDINSAELTDNDKVTAKETSSEIKTMHCNDIAEVVTPLKTKSDICYVRVRKLETLIAKPNDIATENAVEIKTAKIEHNIFDYDTIDTKSLSDKTYYLNEYIKKYRDAYMMTLEETNASNNIYESHYGINNDAREIDVSSEDDIQITEIDNLSDDIDNNVSIEFQSDNRVENIDSRRSSLQSDGSEKNMSEEYLDMSLFDEDDKMEFINNIDIKNDEIVSDSIQNVDSPVNVYNNLNATNTDVCSNAFNEVNDLGDNDMDEYTDNNHDNDIFIDKCIDYNENFSPLINKVSVELQNNPSNAKESDYIVVYKIVNSDSDNDSHLLKIKNEINTDQSEATKSSDKSNGHIDYYYKQRKILQRTMKNNIQDTSEVINADTSNVTVKKDCVTCGFKNKSIIISDNNIRYCLHCSSIFDTAECKYCIGKYNKECSCDVHETGKYECDTCNIRVKSKKDIIEHINGKNCQTSTSTAWDTSCPILGH